MKKFFKKEIAGRSKKAAKVLQNSFGKVAEKIQIKMALDISKDIAKDLQSPKGATIFVTAVIVPGGLPLYFAERVKRKYDSNKKTSPKRSNKKSP